MLTMAGQCLHRRDGRDGVAGEGERELRGSGEEAAAAGSFSFAGEASGGSGQLGRGSWRRGCCSYGVPKVGSGCSSWRGCSRGWQGGKGEAVEWAVGGVAEGCSDGVG